MQRGHAPTNIDVEEEHANCLRDDGRERRARNPPAENEDGNRLEHNVDPERDSEQDRRRLAVTERADEAVLQIEQEKYGQPRKDDGDEVICTVQNLGRRLHQHEQRPRQRQDNRRQRERNRNAEDDARRRTLPYARAIVRTKALPRIDGDARAEAHEEAECQEHETARAANRRERIHAEEAPDDERIDKGVELLHHIPRNERQRKEEDEPRGITLGQILRHSRYLVTKMRSFSCKNTVFVRSALAFGANLIR